ncbi:MAG: amidophosphoribosyltransferase [Planctomycetia bacterium]|nr:amidophosphoribosyltransferase [Planctomycetia bacterium]
MSEVLQHECSVAALYWMDEPHAPAGDASKSVKNENITPLLQQMLAEMQNRGQLAAGIAVYNPGKTQLLDVYKQTGTVNEVFRTTHPKKFEAILTDYAGRAGIGHTRYATCGQDEVRYAQPFERQHGRLWKWFCFAFNGTLANFPQLREELLSKDQYHISLNVDTEIIMHSIARVLQGDDAPDLADVMRQLSSHFDGAYNIVFIDGLGRMFAARDPVGIRPLCWAVQGNLLGVASESIALQNLGFRDIKHFRPGEILVADKNGYELKRYVDSPTCASCFFEWIYFANAASEIDGCSVYLSREKCGDVLAETEDVPWDENSIVVPVPDTAKSAAGGYSNRAKIPFAEGLLRNRYAGRTFIISEDSRDYAVRSKYWVIPSVLKGKKVFLVDDSIVRSTTLRALVRRLREVGQVSEIHVRISCPPVLSPCFYGIDMSQIDELYAPAYIPLSHQGEVTKEMLDEMARDLDVDTLRFLPVSRVADCIGLPETELCLGCVNRQYPTPCGRELFQKAVSCVGHKQGRIFEAD